MLFTLLQTANYSASTTVVHVQQFANKLRMVVRGARYIQHERGVNGNGEGYNWCRQGGVEGGISGTIMCLELLWPLAGGVATCTPLHPYKDKSKIGVKRGGQVASTREHCMRGGKKGGEC